MPPISPRSLSLCSCRTLDRSPWLQVSGIHSNPHPFKARRFETSDVRVPFCWGNLHPPVCVPLLLLAFAVSLFAATHLIMKALPPGVDGPESTSELKRQAELIQLLLAGSLGRLRWRWQELLHTTLENRNPAINMQSWSVGRNIVCSSGLLFKTFSVAAHGAPVAQAKRPKSKPLSLQP